VSINIPVFVSYYKIGGELPPSIAKALGGEVFSLFLSINLLKNAADKNR
jgi:hypothetical protein